MIASISTQLCRIFTFVILVQIWMCTLIEFDKYAPKDECQIRFDIEIKTCVITNDEFIHTYIIETNNCIGLKPNQYKTISCYNRMNQPPNVKDIRFKLLLITIWIFTCCCSILFVYILLGFFHLYEMLKIKKCNNNSKFVC